MDRYTLKNKIYGALFGHAIGDALGLGAEFMTEHEMRHYYPEGLDHYSKIRRDAHRSAWKPGDWTSDTDWFLGLIDTVLENKSIYPKAYALRLKEWYDSDPVDVPSNVRWILTRPNWVENPTWVAERAWNNMTHAEPSNEASTRGVVAAMVSDEYIKDTERIVLITHSHSICVSSAMLIARMAHSLLWEDSPASISELMKLCEKYDSRTREYLEIAYNNHPEALEIDDPDYLWDAKKTMAIALWSVWHCSSPEEALHKVIGFAGDADTNAAAAMTLNGIKYGFDALPVKLIEDLVQKDRLLSAAADFTELVKEIKGIQ